MKQSVKSLDKEITNLKEIKLEKRIKLGTKIFIKDINDKGFLGEFDGEDKNHIIIKAHDNNGIFYYMLLRCEIKVLKTFYEK